jgi:hypothetical protein
MDKPTKEETEERFPNRARDGTRYSDLKPLRSAAGWYVGRDCWNDEFAFVEPYSRESGYFATEEETARAMLGGFEIRQCVENEAGMERGDLPRLPQTISDRHPSSAPRRWNMIVIVDHETASTQRCLLV